MLKKWIFLWKTL